MFIVNFCCLFYIVLITLFSCQEFSDRPLGIAMYHLVVLIANTNTEQDIEAQQLVCASPNTFIVSRMFTCFNYSSLLYNH